LHEIGGIDVGP